MEERLDQPEISGNSQNNSNYEEQLAGILQGNLKDIDLDRIDSKFHDNIITEMFNQNLLEDIENIIPKVKNLSSGTILMIIEVEFLCEALIINSSQFQFISPLDLVKIIIDKQKYYPVIDFIKNLHSTIHMEISKLLIDSDILLLEPIFDNINDFSLLDNSFQSLIIEKYGISSFIQYINKFSSLTFDTVKLLIDNNKISVISDHISLIIHDPAIVEFFTENLNSSAFSKTINFDQLFSGIDSLSIDSVSNLLTEMPVYHILGLKDIKGFISLIFNKSADKNSSFELLFDKFILLSKYVLERKTFNTGEKSRRNNFISFFEGLLEINLSVGNIYNFEDRLYNSPIFEVVKSFNPESHNSSIKIYNIQGFKPFYFILDSLPELGRRLFEDLDILSILSQDNFYILSVFKKSLNLIKNSSSSFSGKINEVVNEIFSRDDFYNLYGLYISDIIVSEYSSSMTDIIESPSNIKINNEYYTDPSSMISQDPFLERLGSLNVAYGEYRGDYSDIDQSVKTSTYKNIETVAMFVSHIDSLDSDFIDLMVTYGTELLLFYGMSNLNDYSFCLLLGGLVRSNLLDLSLYKSLNFKGDIHNPDANFVESNKELINKIRNVFMLVNNFDNEYFGNNMIVKIPIIEYMIENIDHFSDADNDDFHGFLSLIAYIEDKFDIKLNLREKREYIDTILDDFVKQRSFSQILFNEYIKKYSDCIHDNFTRFTGFSADSQYLGLTKLEYSLMVPYIYPKGEYSDYEKNLSCGNHQEHLEKYIFSREGTDFEIDGLEGYKLKEGKDENLQLLSDFSGRIEYIKDIIHTYGDKALLEKWFSEKLSNIFDDCLDEFKIMENLSVEEKIFAIILSFIHSGKKSKEVIDLLVLYKYIFLSDIDKYINNTATQVEKEKDEISQRRQLWNYLSSIYGEDVNHIMKNEIYSKIKTQDNCKNMLDIFKEKSLGNTENSLSDKQIGSIRSIIENLRIDNSLKPDIIRKKLWAIFIANISFSHLEKELFIKEFDSIVKTIIPESDLDSILAIIPSLFQLRNRYRVNLDNKLQMFFNSDISLILNEVSKYEEILEVETKKADSDGETKTVSKKVKKRNIRRVFIKTKESANARMGAFLCISGDTNMYENQDYFEEVYFDNETGKCVGLTMFLNIESNDGKKYLWFGPNPFESLLDKVSSKKMYDEMYSSAVKFAQDNGFDGVVVPSKDDQILGECTNRGGDFPDLIKNSRLTDISGNLKIVEFGNEHVLAENYSYNSGALIREK